MTAPSEKTDGLRFEALPRGEIRKAAEWAAACDPDIELVDDVQDDQAEHGINTHEEMYGPAA